MEPEREKFIQLYNENSEAIYRHFFFRIYSKGRAEELMQEAFLKLWQYVEEGHVVQNPRGLLYRIADHLIIDEKRKRTIDSLEGLRDREGFDPAGSERMTPEQKSLYQEIFDELEELREEERKIFILRYVDDLDPKEIAHIMETTANTISVQLNRIVKKLRDKVSDH